MTKEKKLKVPKRIAGVKVPKKIRKSANKALAIAENPAARELAIAALTAAAAALADKKGTLDSGKEAGEDGLQTAKAQAAKLGDMVIAAALEGARRLLEPLETAAETPKKQQKPKRRRANGGSAAAPPEAG